MPNEYDYFDDDDLDNFEPNRQAMARAAAIILLFLIAAGMIAGTLLTFLSLLR